MNVNVALFFFPSRPRCTKRIMFQFTLHSHATENATVVYLTGFRAETLVGRAALERSAGRSVGRSISTISAPTGRGDSDAVTENLKKKKIKKEEENRNKNGRNGHTRGGRGRDARARTRGEIAASTTDKKGARARAVFQEENIAAR